MRCGLRKIKLERSEGGEEREKGKKCRGHRYSSSATIALVGIGYMDWVCLVGIAGLEILDAERRTDEAGAAGFASSLFGYPMPSGSWAKWGIGGRHRHRLNLKRWKRSRSRPVAP